MNKPKYEDSDRVYNKCEVEGCLNAGIPMKLGNRSYIFCKRHIDKKYIEDGYDFSEWLSDVEYDPELFDEFGDKIVY